MSGSTLPPGHPAAGARPGTAAGQAQLEPDVSTPSAEVPPGTIEVMLVDGAGAPLPAQDLKLAVHFQKIAEGESRSERAARTDASGVARFSGLTTGLEYQYRVLTSRGPAEYASAPFSLKPDQGHVVKLHVYPLTRSINEAMVAARGYIYVETRDDVFQFEVLFRIFNIGPITWVPDNVVMRLPAGFKAFKANEGMSDVRFEAAENEGARLLGTFSPGQHDVSMRFQLPREEVANASFRFGLLPHVAEVRVIAEAAPSMSLDVEGFESPQIDVNQNGQRVLVTRHVARRGESEMKSFQVSLAGIPTPGPGRWIAVLLASALAVAGFGVYRGWLGRVTAREARRDAERARRLLLDELVALERARQTEQIGQGTYEQARRVLLESLARIVSTAPAPSDAARSSRRPDRDRRPRAERRDRERPETPDSTG